jgi:uncharacterized membrane protein YhaH (DUF805 family)
MNDRIKRDWWIPAPIVLSGLITVVQLMKIVGDRWGSLGSDPSVRELTGAIVLVGSLFVVLPIWAIAIRRRHPGWTVAMLLPTGILSLMPLAWGEVTWSLLLSILGVVTLVGAIMNLAQRSLEAGPDPSPPQTQRAGG